MINSMIWGIIFYIWLCYVGSWVEARKVRNVGAFWNRPRISAHCPCGSENYNFGDWISHWKYGMPRPGKFLGRWPKIRAVWMFLNTDIRFNW